VGMLSVSSCSCSVSSWCFVSALFVVRFSPCSCRKPPINVPYTCTFGSPDQGQMLDV
jgi:hypothetical protein